MSADQNSLYVAAGVVVLYIAEKAWAVFSTGRKEAQSLDEMVDAKIKQALEEKAKSDHQLDEAKREIQDLRFEQMMADISRISESMAEIMRMLRESVATKQDILQMDARIDASEESHRDHYESFKKLREQVNASEARLRDEINALRLSCARYHRTGDTASAPKSVVV